MFIHVENRMYYMYVLRKQSMMLVYDGEFLVLAPPGSVEYMFQYIFI